MRTPRCLQTHKCLVLTAGPTVQAVWKLSEEQGRALRQHYHSTSVVPCCVEPFCAHFPAAFGIAYISGLLTGLSSL